MTAENLHALLRCALAGAGLVWSSEDLHGKTLTTSDGRVYRLGDLVFAFVKENAGSRRDGPHLVGRFFGRLIRLGLLRAEDLHSVRPKVDVG